MILLTSAAEKLLLRGKSRSSH